MRGILLAAGAALSLAACGSNDTTDANADMNAMATDNMMATNDMGGLDANMATNAATEANMVMNDLTTNDADANLANGM